MKRMDIIPAIVFAAAFASGFAWTAVSAEDSPPPVKATVGPYPPPARPVVPYPAATPAPANDPNDPFASPPYPSTGYTATYPAVPAIRQWRDKADAYGQAISEAVAAGAVTIEEGSDLAREFEAFIAVRQARLDILRGMQLLEKTAEDKDTKETKEGKQARRLLDALPKRDRLNLDAESSPKCDRPNQEPTLAPKVRPNLEPRSSPE